MSKIWHPPSTGSWASGRASPDRRPKTQDPGPSTWWKDGKRPILLACLAALLLTLPSCTAFRRDGDEAEFVQRGEASYYGLKFHGRRTASGELYDMFRLTAAHRELPFGSIVEVTNLDNGKRVRVKINDRGPFAHGRIIDLSYRAAQRVDLVGPGTARVELRLIHDAGRADLASEYEVQVGAFRDRHRAEAVRQRLTSSYETVRLQADGVWNRILIGPFDRRQDAEALRGELLASGFMALVKTAE